MGGGYTFCFNMGSVGGQTFLRLSKVFHFLQLLTDLFLVFLVQNGSKMSILGCRPLTYKEPDPKTSPGSFITVSAAFDRSGGSQ